MKTKNGLKDVAAYGLSMNSLHLTDLCAEEQLRQSVLLTQESIDHMKREIEGIDKLIMEWRGKQCCGGGHVSLS